MAKTKKKGNPLLTVVALSALTTVLLLVTTVSVPINKVIRVFRLYAWVSGQNQMRYVDFGVWGYCIVPTGKEHSEKWFPSYYTNCTQATLGWTIGQDVTQVFQVSDAFQGALPKSHTSFLVLYPIATVASFLVFIVSLVVHRKRIANRVSIQTPVQLGHAKAILAFADFATIITMLALAAHISIALRMSHRIQTAGNATMKFQVENGIWVCGAAFLCHVFNFIVVRRMKNGKDMFGAQPPAQPNFNAPMIGPEVHVVDVDALPNSHATPTTPQFPEPIVHSANPPSYAAATQGDPAPHSQSPLIAESGRWNFLRFGNNASHV